MAVNGKRGGRRRSGGGGQPGREALGGGRSSPSRNLLLLKQMVKRFSFNEILQMFERKKLDLSSLNVDALALIIHKHVKLNDTTAQRRASTVINWLRG
jgi:hypothetical protein